MANVRGQGEILTDWSTLTTWDVGTGPVAFAMYELKWWSVWLDVGGTRWFRDLNISALGNADAMGRTFGLPKWEFVATLGVAWDLYL